MRLTLLFSIWSMNMKPKEYRSPKATLIPEGWDYDPCCSCKTCKSIRLANSKADQEEGNKPMRNETNIDVRFDGPSAVDREKRGYLGDRLFQVYRKHFADMETKFGLVDDKPPRSPKELFERLTSGRFVVTDNQFEITDKDDAKNFSGYDPVAEHIRWRDPSVKEDREGFKAAEKVLEQAQIKARDQIKILSPEEGLKALQEFESFTLN